MEPEGSLPCSQEPSSGLQSMPPHAISLISVFSLPTHLNRCSHIGPFPSRSPINNLYPSLSTPIRSTCPSNHILIDLSILIILGEQYKL
jgi:hypothetical protein